MAQWRPDQSFYPSPRMAMRAPAETLAYVALINPQPKKTGLVYACGFQAVQIGNPGNYRLTNAGRRHLYQEVAN